MSKNVLSKKVMNALRKQGVKLEQIEAAVVQARGYEPKVTRKVINSMKSKLKNVGDRIVVTAHTDQLVVLTMKGYESLVKNAKKARAHRHPKMTPTLEPTEKP